MPWLQLWTVVSAGVLMAATYRLWLPPGASSFPHIPATAWLVNAPGWCDTVVLVGLITAMLLSIVLSVFHGCWILPQSKWIQSGELHRLTFVSLLLLGIAIVLLNQHRLQAWFYQLLIYCVVFLLSDYDQQLRWLRRVVVSIYVYSALGKLDYEFAHTTGQELLAAGFQGLGLQFDAWSVSDRVTLALCQPLAELVLAIALGWSVLKLPLDNCSLSVAGRIALAIPGVLTCLFHLLLGSLMLWQLQHSWGVVLWNVQFALQAVLLFVLAPLTCKPANNTDGPASLLIPTRAWNGPIQLSLLAVMILPLAERMGYWDHWPSWALYAPHSSRVSVAVAPFAVAQLPEDLQAILPESGTNAAAVQLPLGQWSLNSLGVPIYPQSRFQLGVARHLANDLQSRFATQCELLSVADRFTGQRQSQLLNGAEQLERAGNQFWLNSQPRPWIDHR